MNPNNPISPFKMRITETLKTAHGERFIEVEGQVHTQADRDALIEAVEAALDMEIASEREKQSRKERDEVAQEVLTERASRKRKTTLNNGLNKVAPEQTPSSGVTATPTPSPVAQVQPLEAGTIIYAPGTSPVAPMQAPVAAYTATNTSPVVDAKGVPAMFSEANMKILAERQAMMSAKPAPIVAPFSTMSGPTVLPQKMNPALAPPNIPAGITPVYFAPADPNVVVPFQPPMVR